MIFYWHFKIILVNGFMINTCHISEQNYLIYNKIQNQFLQLKQFNEKCGKPIVLQLVYTFCIDIFVEISVTFLAVMFTTLEASFGILLRDLLGLPIQKWLKFDTPIQKMSKFY